LEKALNIRAVLLDIDGLMLDPEPVYRRAWQSAAAGHRIGIFRVPFAPPK
jgi:beta-phosphoglucomutase-like phosphatase (HAD superfamily)